VDSDLTYLQNACQSPTHFVGGVELAKFAKECHVISNMRCSLSDLCATILLKRLDKNVSEQISQAWEDRNLTLEQLLYAAKDAVVSLLLYLELSKLDCPCPLLEYRAASMPVLLFSADNTTVIAEGQISACLYDHRFDNINITPTQMVIDVQRVLVPGAIINSYHGWALNTFGTVPFSIVCLKSHLRSYHPPDIQTVHDQPHPDSIPNIGTSLDSSLESISPDAKEEEMTSIGQLLHSDLSGPSMPDILRNSDMESTALGDTILGPNPAS